MKTLAGLVGAAALVFTVACGHSDAGITTSVKTTMAADETVKAYQVDVTTENRVVTLSGDVETSAARDRAIEIARDTDGVADVIDQLRVVDTAATSGIDAPDIDVDVDVDDDTENAIERGAGAVTDGAKKGADAVTEGAKKGANAVKEGAKKTGEAVKDAVTDDDRDSDKDGH
jgi:hypothetical protein